MAYEGEVDADAIAKLTQVMGRNSTPISDDLNNTRLQRMINAFNKKKHPEGKVNFINQCDPYPASFCIPPANIPQVMSLLWECSKKTLFPDVEVAPISYSEPQNKEASGIMLDFDILQDCEESQITLEIVQSLITYTFMILSDMIEPGASSISSDSTYILVLKKPAPVFKQDENSYKDGFHIVIPGIKLSREAKRYLISELNVREYIKSAFEGVDIIGLEKVLDRNSAHVPILFPGSSKAHKPAYQVFAMFKSKLIRQMIQVIQCDDSTIKSMNLVYEFSVNHENPEGVIKKITPTLKEDILPKFKSNSFEAADVAVDAEMKSASPDIGRISDAISLLSKERCEDYHTWFRIMAALAYMGEDYKSIALRFSAMRAKGVRAEFETAWNRLCANKNRYPYTKDLIYHYASIDNPEEYSRLVNSDAFKYLVDTIFNNVTQGSIDHWHIAKLLKLMVPNKYVYDTNRATGRDEWYEFITEGDPHLKGEIYKWRQCGNPHTLRNIISTKLPNLFQKASMNIMETMASIDAANSKKIEYYKSVKKRVDTSFRSLYNHGFKNGVIGECSTVFRSEGFISSLDNDPFILGVGNGVLHFEDGIPNLIEGSHDFRVSRYTPYEYRKINVEDPLALAVFTSFANLFPVGEEDAFNFRMIMEATSLTGENKKLIILMVTGGGANGKTFFDESHRTMLNDVESQGYSHKMSASYLTEPIGNSNSATPGICGLKYARSTVFSETRRGDILNAQAVKNLLSGDMLVMRPLYGKSESAKVVSTFKSSSNFPYFMEDRSYGALRRILIYIMKKKFVRNPDPTNPFEMLDDPNMATVNLRNPDWLSTILSISVMYYTIFKLKYDGDLSAVPHDTIKRETEEYVNKQDTVNRFICEKVVNVGDDSIVSVDSIVQSYIEWHKDTVTHNAKYDRSDLRDSFLDSKLTPKIIRDDKGPQFSRIRVLSVRDSVLSEGETMFIQHAHKPAKEYKAPEPDRIRQMFVEFVKLHDNLVATKMS